ncbi:heptaprenyl diphosphate synthase, partial [Staphylococcus aureus]|nr:heptaprenyl diphosphate synthase [Staphylococcus aureus]
FNSQQTIINYLRRINRKTALLIQLSTEVGAITSQSDKETVRKEFDECIQIIRKSDSIDEAKSVSSKYLSKALDLISELPDGHPKSLLLSLTKKMGSRNT